jgi:hypothetical protein
VADEPFLIDGNSLAYRAFLALPESLATSTGGPTNSFASMLTEDGPRDASTSDTARTPGRPEVGEPTRRSASPTKFTPATARSRSFAPEAATG